MRRSASTEFDLGEIQAILEIDGAIDGMFLDRLFRELVIAVHTRGILAISQLVKLLELPDDECETNAEVSTVLELLGYRFSLKLRVAIARSIDVDVTKSSLLCNVLVHAAQAIMAAVSFRGLQIACETNDDIKEKVAEHLDSLSQPEEAAVSDFGQGPYL